MHVNRDRKREPRSKTSTSWTVLIELHGQPVPEPVHVHDERWGGVVLYPDPNVRKDDHRLQYDIT